MSNDAKSNNAASQDESLKDRVSTASTAPSSPVTAKSPVNTNEGDDLYLNLNLSRAGSYSPSSPWIAGTSAVVSRVSPLFTPWLITLCDRLPTTSMPPRPMPSGTSPCTTATSPALLELSGTSYRACRMIRRRRWPLQPPRLTWISRWYDERIGFL